MGIATIAFVIFMFRVGQVADSGMKAFVEAASANFDITPMDLDTHHPLSGCRMFVNEDEILQQADGSFSGQVARGTTTLVRIESCEGGYPPSGAMLVMPAEFGQEGLLTDFEHNPIGPSLGFQWGIARPPAQPGQQI
jgi:hypothetical protein